MPAPARPIEQMGGKTSMNAWAGWNGRAAGKRSTVKERTRLPRNLSSPSRSSCSSGAASGSSRGRAAGDDRQYVRGAGGVSRCSARACGWLTRGASACGGDAWRTWGLPVRPVEISGRFSAWLGFGGRVRTDLGVRLAMIEMELITRARDERLGAADPRSKDARSPCCRARPAGGTSSAMPRRRSRRRAIVRSVSRPPVSGWRQAEGRGRAGHRVDRQRRHDGRMRRRKFSAFVRGRAEKTRRARIDAAKKIRIPTRVDALAARRQRKPGCPDATPSLIYSGTRSLRPRSLRGYVQSVLHREQEAERFSSRQALSAAFSRRPAKRAR